MNTKKVYSIIGASAAGIAAAKKIRALQPDARIVCYTDELQNPYNKCYLVDWLSHEKHEDDLYLQSTVWYQEQNIEIVHARVIHIDAEQQLLTLNDGSTHAYAQLLLATGAQPRQFESLFPSISEHISECIIPFYTLEQTQNIMQLIETQSVQQVVIIGGGMSGIECADAVAQRGIQVTVLERSTQILQGLTTEQSASYMAQRAHQYGVTVPTDTSVIACAYEQQKNKIIITCADGTQYQADFIITALGSSVDCSLAQQAGIICSDGAVETNAYLQTNNPSIFAAGDCARVYNLLESRWERSRLWSDAVLQGTIAGTNMVALERTYKGVMPLTVSHLFGYHFISCHTAALYNQKYTQEYIEYEGGYRFVAYDQNKVVKGFVLYEKEVAYTHLKRSLMNQTPVE